MNVSNQQNPSRDEGQIDHIQRFYGECLEKRVEALIAATKLYEAYCDWCERSNIEPLALPHFGKIFDTLDVRKARVAGRVVWFDVAFKDGIYEEATKTPTYQVDAA